MLSMHWLHLPYLNVHIRAVRSAPHVRLLSSRFVASTVEAVLCGWLSTKHHSALQLVLSDFL